MKLLTVVTPRLTLIDHEGVEMSVTCGGGLQRGVKRVCRAQRGRDRGVGSTAHSPPSSRWCRPATPSFCLTPPLSLFLLFLLSSAVSAQIATDGSVGPALELTGPAYQIGHDLGSRVGDNLFHSFQRFNIQSGESATFTGPDSISSVISRVTGGEFSTINGLLRSEVGQADFYFLNLAGVLFGPNAQIDLPAAFHVATPTNFASPTEAYSALVIPPAALLPSRHHPSLAIWRHNRPISSSQGVNSPSDRGNRSPSAAAMSGWSSARSLFPEGDSPLWRWGLVRRALRDERRDSMDHSRAVPLALLAPPAQ